jgi:DNA (cytosine-5)-methyltransferase 1
MTPPRVGSLFAGYGGLEMGITSVLGGHPAWFSEIDPAPSRVLAHHWPTVPNLGDITQVDWDTVEPVDVLTGGFPCQDVSHAGKRLGLKPGTRSGLWSHMAYAIDKLRPSLVVAENVRGLLSAEAGGDLEPCPWCVGDGEGSPLRALGAVLGDLADLGYDAQWHGVRASDAGAPHGRFRVFVFAWPAGDTEGAARGGTQLQRVGAATGPAAEPREPARAAAFAPADADRVGHQRPRDTRGRRGRPTDSGVPTPPHADVPGWEGTQPTRGRHLPPRGATADATGDGRHEGRTQPTRLERGPHVAERGAVDWGDYEPAIRRWENVTGRLAPAPTEPGKNGADRLSPAFVEWMMGLPAGHVTAVPGLSRNDQLKALGNGVVPQQAAHATHLWAATHTPARCSA